MRLSRQEQQASGKRHEPLKSTGFIFLKLEDAKCVESLDFMAQEETGCMRVLPGSHVGDLLPHKDEFERNNMLTRGQDIAVTVDDSKTVAMPLQPGEVSMHNVRLAHASGPNCSDERRIGLSMHYMPTFTQQMVGEWDSERVIE